MVVEDVTRVKDYLNKTKLTTLDYVINPYVGCPNKCLYCYAAYMSSFSKHSEEWGEFIDIKRTNKRINIFKIKNKKVMISTVTDPYNSFEEKYATTRMIMEQLVKSEAFISVVTKSKLVLRDIDLFKKMKHVEVAISMSILDEQVKKKIEPYSSSIQERLDTLKTLKQNGIRTIVFVAPIIPQFTDFKRIIEVTKDYTDEYWFDKLNLRSSFKTKMFKFIDGEYPIYKSIYDSIYNRKDTQYFDELSDEIEKYCTENNISFKNFYAGT
jgi:radical SAM domain protein